MTYPNGTKVSVRNTPNVENGEEGIVVGYYHAGPLLKVDFGGKVVFCSAENCTDVVGTTKDEKIKEVMKLVDRVVYGEFMQERATSHVMDKEGHRIASEARESIESKLRELIQ